MSTTLPTPTPPDLRRAATRLLRQMLRVSIGWELALLVTSVVGAVAGLLLPAALGAVIDAQLRGTGGDTAIARLGFLLAAAVVTEALGQFLAPACNASAVVWLRRRLVGHVLAVGVRGQRRFPPGDVVSRVSANSAEAASVVTTIGVSLTAALSAVGGVVALGWIDPWLAVTFLLGVPVGIWLIRVFVGRASGLMARYMADYGTISTRLVDALGGIRTVRAAGTVEREADRVLAPAPGLREAGLAMWREQARVSWQSGLLAPFMQVAVLAVAGYGLAHGSVTPGQMLAAVGYVGQALGFFAQAGVFMALARAHAGARRVVEVLAVPELRYGPREHVAGPGALTLRAVTVRHEGSAVLDRLDLTLPAGASVAVVGRSGTGKSVLAAVAGRLVDPDEGEVLLDATPLRELSAGALRRTVAYAFERPVLMGRTVADAIAYGRPQATFDQVRTAARTACADTFVTRLPEGYRTPMSGTVLSGGEFQRLGLARACAQDGRILILDDATSSLDTVTEMQVSTAVARAATGRTRLVVAHRAATAARADLVVWLDEGRIRASGAHRDLWHDPDYRQVFRPEQECDGEEAACSATR